MTGSTYSRPFLPLVVAMMAGIAVGSSLGGYGTWILISCVVILGWLIYTIFCHKGSTLVPLLLFTCLGYLLIQPWSAPAFPDHHITHFTDGKKWQISGIIATQPVRRDDRSRFILHVATLSDSEGAYPVTGKIRVTVSESIDDLRRGDQIALASRIRSIRNFNNPGGFDYQGYMRNKNIWGSAYVREEKLTFLKRAYSNRLSIRIDEARSKIADHIANKEPGDQAAVLKALLIGDRSGISPQLYEAFHRCGIGHLLAISGLHIGIIASVAFFCCNRLFSRFNSLLWRAATRRWAAVAAFIPVLIYGLLAGMSPSTQRATIMVGVFLLTFLVKREQDVMNTLALAAAVILILYPPALFSISFQLSFLAVFWIIFGLSRFNRLSGPHRSDLRSRLTARLITFFLVSLLATLGTLPMVMYYFNQISLIGVFTNAIFVPVIGFVVVPVGLLAVFLLPISAMLSHWMMKFSAGILESALGWVTNIAVMPAAAVKTVTPSALEIACYYLLLWASFELLTLLVERRNTPLSDVHQTDSEEISSAKGKPGLNTLLGKKRRWATFVLISVLLISGVDAGYWSFQRFFRQDLRVTFIDVGQGSAALLELPGGYCILADGGGFSNNEIFDIGARVVAPFLWHKKIKTIETLILSHPNSDHLNGLLYIAEHFHVKNMWTNSQARDTRGYRQLMEVVRRKKINKPDFRDLGRQFDISGVDFTVIHPDADFLDKVKTDPRYRRVNSNSLVFKASLGKTSFLFTGDITASAEKKITTATGDRIGSTVLLIPHHGSLSSSSPVFINSVHPDIGVISVGWKNRFNHPHPQILERYRQRGVKLYRTDRQGAVQFVTDGKDLRVSSYLKDALKPSQL